MTNSADQNHWRLAIAFWVYSVAGTFLVVGVPALFAGYLEEWPLWAGITLAAGMLAYVVWAHVTLWRRASLASSRGMRIAVKTYVIFAILAVIGATFGPQHMCCDEATIKKNERSLPAP